MAIQEAGFIISGEASNPSDLLHSCRNEMPKIVIIDFQIPENQGIRLIEDLLDIDPSVAIIVIIESMTGYGEKVLVSGARAFLQKPFSMYDLIDMMRKVTPVFH